MFTIPTTQLRTAFSRLFHQPATKSRVSPSAVRNREYNVTLMKADAICRAELCRKGLMVFILNNIERTDRVLSLREEYCDPNFKEHVRVVNYRANVYSTVTKEVRFVDLVPGQLLEVR